MKSIVEKRGLVKKNYNKKVIIAAVFGFVFVIAAYFSVLLIIKPVPILLAPEMPEEKTLFVGSKTDFDLGSYENNTYNENENAVMLISGNAGKYISKVFDGAENSSVYTIVNWTEISWESFGIERIGEELPDYQQNTWINMTGNVLLLHFNTDANDSSGNDNHGIAYATLNETGGIEKGAYEFDGVDDSINFTNNIIANNSITLAAWVKHNVLAGAIQRYITVSDEVAVLRYSYAATDNYRLHFYIKTDDTLRHLYADNALTTGEWYYVAGTWNGTDQKLYKNGVLITSQIPGGILNSPTTPMISLAGEPMNGLIDEVAIWNRSLSEEEIKQIYLRRENMKMKVRACDDENCSDDGFTVLNQSPYQFLPALEKRYFQFEAEFETETGASPKLYNVTLIYTTQKIPDSCEDSGNNTEEKGNVTLYSSGKRSYYEDFCENSTLLSEYYCDALEIKNQTHTCVSCQDGVCLRCIDSDGGKEYYLKGNITTLDKEVLDSCKDENVLLEGACEDGGKTEAYVCLRGCKEGACLSDYISLIEPENNSIVYGENSITFRYISSIDNVSYGVYLANESNFTFSDEYLIYSGNSRKIGKFIGYGIYYWKVKVSNETLTSISEEYKFKVLIDASAPAIYDISLISNLKENNIARIMARVEDNNLRDVWVLVREYNNLGFTETIEKMSYDNGRYVKTFKVKKRDYSYIIYANDSFGNENNTEWKNFSVIGVEEITGEKADAGLGEEEVRETTEKETTVEEIEEVKEPEKKIEKKIFYTVIFILILAILVVAISIYFVLKRRS